MVQFVPLKLNVDSDDANKVRRQFPIQGNRLPFVYVIRADNKKIYGASGGLPGDQLPAMMREALRQAGRILSPAQENSLRTATALAKTAFEAGDLYRTFINLQPSMKAGLLGPNAGFSAASTQATELLSNLSQQGLANLESLQFQLDSNEPQMQSLFTLLLGQRIYQYDEALLNKYQNTLKEVEKNTELISTIEQAREIEKAFLVQYARGGKSKAVHALTRLALLSRTNAKRELILQELRRLEGSDFELPHFEPFAMRTWKDESGNFSISAKVVSISGSNVILETEGNEQITVPIIRLGKEERELLKLIQP